jgi:endonuclease-8
MPEGDTVWLAGQRLHEALAGRVLLRSDFRVPQLATVDLRGRAVLAVRSRGKHLLTRIEGALTLHTHFRMDGSWHLYRPRDRWRGGPAWQVRAVLVNAQWQAVGYRLPVVELIPTDAEDTVVGHLGPDLLGADWDPAQAVRPLGADPGGEIGPPVWDQRNSAGSGIDGDGGTVVAAGYWVEAEALRRLSRQPEEAIGAALLDQRNLAGAGTLYRTETLFLRGVHPETPAGEVSDLAGVVRKARQLMLANRYHPEQSTTGDLRRGRQHWVFQRQGQPCRRCGTRIMHNLLGPLGKERPSYWCPRCQPR